MTEKRFTYTTRIITDKKGYCKYYILDKETLLNTEQIVAILNAQDEYIDYVTKERNIAYNKLDKQQSTISQLETENDNMNLFIKQTIEPLLFNCVFELDTIESMSQVELSRKIENEIIPFIQDFKYLKYESPEEEKQDKSE